MEFSKIGQHCQVALCHQQEYLPFECEFCQMITCTKHARPDDHKCAVGGDRDSIYVILCPICDFRIRLPGKDKDADKIWQSHVDSGDCKQEKEKKDQRDAEEAQKVKKCQQPKCNKGLTDINRYQCSQCLMTLCLSHRFPEAHKCQQFVTKDPRLAKSKLLQRSNQPSAQQKSLVEAPVNSANDMSRLNYQINQFSQPQPTSQPQRNAPANSFGGARPQASASLQGQAREKCPICGAFFPDIMALISHSEATHTQQQEEQQWEQFPGVTTQTTATLKTGHTVKESEKCPQCAKRFTVTELVTHMQQDHFMF